MRLTIDAADAPNEFGRGDRAIREGLTHLYQLGHRHFGMLGVGQRDYGKETMQDQAFRSWLASRGLQAAKGDVLELGWVDDRTRSLAAYLGRDKLPTAVFSSSPLYTRAFLDVAGQLGIKVPEDISLLTFCDPLAVQDLAVDLTLADPLSYQHAYDATAKLIQMARGGEIAAVPAAANCRFHPGATCATCGGEWFLQASAT